MIFEGLPIFQKIGYISHSPFQRTYHVTPVSDGNLVVVSTGLDMVFKVSREGKVLNEWTVLDKPIWSRFSKDVKLSKSRKKTQESHPNFAFEQCAGGRLGQPISPT